jgi:hypothetical protein
MPWSLIQNHWLAAKTRLSHSGLAANPIRAARVAKTLAIAFALIAQLVLVETSFLQLAASVRLCDRAALRKQRLIGASHSDLNSL